MRLRCTLAASVAAFTIVISSPTAQAETVAFHSTGAEQSFTVPAGVTSLHVVAIGGKGADGNLEGIPSGLGGFGAAVAADLAVTPGQTLYVEVGGNGVAPSSESAVEAFNGGGSGALGAVGRGISGGGGGASDLQTMSHSAGAAALSSRLIIASGGGGGGGGGPEGQGNGGGGFYGEGGIPLEHGSPGEMGGDGDGECTLGSNNGCGGGGAQASEGGVPGFGSCEQSGLEGQLGVGGAGGIAVNDLDAEECESGGGGGGGLYGGGGGGNGGKYGEEGLDNGAAGEGGGGGGGSSYWGPQTNDVLAGPDTTGNPQITLSYSPPSTANENLPGGSGTTAHCVVPKLTGKKVKAAKKKLKAADCKLGKVKKLNGATSKTGKVKSQSPKQGKVLAPGSKVNVKLTA